TPALYPLSLHDALPISAPPDCLRCSVPGRFRAISPEQPEYAAMSQFTFESSLLVRDAEGHYLPATADQILAAARRIVDLKVQRRSEEHTSELQSRENLV